MSIMLGLFYLLIAIAFGVSKGFYDDAPKGSVQRRLLGLLTGTLIILGVITIWLLSQS